MTTLMKRNGNLLMPEIPSLLNEFLSRDIFDWPNSRNNRLPAVNIRETDNSFELEVAAPGMKKKDFNVELNNNMLVISAERSSESEQEDESFTRREFDYTSFRRTFSLEERLVNFEDIKANYEDGILHISIPKSEEAKVKPAKRIKIS